jgi:hypothetical protein
MYPIIFVVTHIGGSFGLIVPQSPQSGLLIPQSVFPVKEVKKKT